MKKLLLTSLGLAIYSLTFAQQLPNSDFSKWKTACDKSYCWSKSTIFSKWSKGDAQRPGIEPESWNGSNINQTYLGVTISKENLVTRPENETSVVKLMNIHPSDQSDLRAPGFLTFAHPWVFPHFKTNVADGGAYGSYAFTYKPDAIRTRVKRTFETTEKAHIIAYLWNGTFKSNIGAGDGSETKEVEDADRAVLGKTTSTQSGKLIASVDYEFTETKNQDWETLTIPLNYVKGTEKEVPTKINVIFSAADYWTRGNIKENNALYVDNIELVYYHGLTSISYDGKKCNDFTEESTDYTLTVNGKFDINKFTYDKKGQGASVDVNKIDDNTYKVVVKAGDYDAAKNPDAMTTYTIHIAEKYTYTNDLTVGVRGTNHVASSFMAPQSTDIILIKETDGSYTFQLNNFVLGSGSEAMGVGNIELTNLSKNGDTFTAEQNIKITKGDDPSIYWMGPSLNEVPVNLTATINGDQMTAHITIDMLNKSIEQFINVIFAPTTKFKDGDIKTINGLANITINRTFKQGWNTVCLPFATSALVLEANENGVQEFTSADEKGLTFTKVANGKIEANKPYLIYFDSETIFDDAYPLCYGGNITANPTPVTYGAYTFSGNYTANMNMNGKYGVANINGVQKLRIGGATATLPAGCAYFTTTNNANGMLIRMDGGNTTGILDVNTGVVVENTAVYNLQGVKVSNNGTAGLPAGIYVMGGKKVIVK